MKTLIQKIHIEADYSFACRTYRTPDFETAWHKHVECELILITAGNGTALIGDHIGDYMEGDVFLLNMNLPHWFRKSKNEDIGSAIVVHFKKDFWGEKFLNLPELATIARVLQNENTGIQLTGELQKEIAQFLRRMEQTAGFDRIQLLLTSLQCIGESSEQNIITTAFDGVSSKEENSIIEAVMEYSFKNFLNPISLKEIAAIANMSISTFCRFFKKNIKKSYFDFLKEIRVSHACKLLRESDTPVLAVCYHCGYNSWSHFSKQFKAVKKASPLQYRKQYRVGGKL
ncbi:AraC family transcriptional regulator [Sphingobacterium deserti]|uniref:Transcriptional regulator, AraC family n=1 Tax=Sphingobacterium deserti TaxID=1229276 RepID=A0A0B8T2L7_9SPHI|nr:AraC family transcriptional regulator [Sphingobacterium deserti]KGE15582.1 transcriptional regulator, AraC family [Sphingobacterium deserti]